ncbi:aldo/keto reductase [Nocardioides bizhenqiangii]|uniref:Aldo/keto reductase n=1 Tax=Nocardioides bizhenqiangii TaxID=3095076 RepID=A0ABZ0ZTK4_9ACTN|nr:MULTISPECIES: aldo/keto reductase [unclassified Nocardioides]MDZ5621762.1 aldo/keto reductase [Nocardioides sp. HM23]WQQ27552.1 aldo/keto reductase [Nocardioides sp. HM61]
MIQVPLGTSGWEVSEFVFGAGSIGGVGTSSATRGKGISREEGLARLDEARGFGITLIDTADAYAGGESERVVGEWLKDRQPDDVLVSTKVGLISRPDGSRAIDNSPEHIERTLKQSLERLGRVDLLLSHAPDRETPLDVTLAAFAKAQESRSIQGYGVSNVDAARLVEVLETADRLRLPRPVVIENRLNLLDRADEAELLPIAHSEGIGYTPFSPLAGGVLSERYLDGAPPPPDSRIAVAGEMYYRGFYTPENLERVTALREVAREVEVGVSALALAWLRDHPSVTAPIIAPSTSAQWEAVREAAVVRVEGDLRDRVSAIFD